MSLSRKRKPGIPTIAPKSKRLQTIIEVNSQGSQVEVEVYAPTVTTAPQSFFQQTAASSSSSSTTDSAYAQACEGFMLALDNFLKSPELQKYTNKKRLTGWFINYLGTLYLGDYENGADLNDIILQHLYNNGVSEGRAYVSLRDLFHDLIIEPYSLAVGLGYMKDKKFFTYLKEYPQAKEKIVLATTAPAVIKIDQEITKLIASRTEELDAELEALIKLNTEKLKAEIKTALVAATTEKLNAAAQSPETLLKAFLAEHFQKIYTKLDAKAPAFIICLTHKMGTIIAENLKVRRPNTVGKLFVKQAHQLHFFRSKWWLQNPTPNKGFSENTYTFRR